MAENNEKLLPSVRLLLVEEKKDRIAHIKNLLAEAEFSHFDVLTKQSVQESLEVPEENYDVAMISVASPDDTAVSSLMHFKNSNPNVPVVAITAQDDESFFVSAIQAGIQECITVKNLNKNILVRALFSAVEHQKMLKNKDDVIHEMEEHFLTHDQLTGLPNKRFLINFLNKNIANDIERKKRFALINIELSGLQQVNYSLGLSHADTLIKSLAKRLSSLYGEIAFVIRPEIYQLCLLFSEDISRKRLAEIAEILIIQLREPIVVLIERIRVTATIGISRYPDDTIDPEDIIEKAYVATRVAKESGWNQYCIYCADVANQVDKYAAMYRDLKTAIDNNELFFLVQPKVDLKTGYAVRGEVLIRWQHPKLGLVSPGQFIEIAEETKMIVAISEWLIRATLDMIRKFLEIYPTNNVLPLDINLSMVQLSQPDFFQIIEGIFSEYRDVLPYLGIEVTETAVMANRRLSNDLLYFMKSHKVHISIDDFGTGYSSLGHLKYLAVDSVKIDRSFISNVHKITQNAEIVKSTIAMIHNLGMIAVAEGAESKEEVEFLIKHGCDQIQGYYFSKPLLPESFAVKAGSEPYQIPAE